MLKRTLFVVCALFLAVALGVSGVLAAAPAAGTPIPAPTSTPVCNPSQTTTCVLTITLVDNGKTFNLKVGQSFLLSLGTSTFSWKIAFSNPGIVVPLPGDMTPLPIGGQGRFLAAKVGATDLVATGTPLCLPLGCAMPSYTFKVHLVVK